MKKYFVLLAMFLAPQAFAGAESHGGQVVSCPGQPAVMLDYWQAELPTGQGGVPELVDLSRMSSDDVLKLVESRLRISNIWYPLDHAYELLGPTNTWLQGSLQDVPDAEPAYTLPPNCALQQVAVRQDTTMYLDPAVYQELSPAQQGILVVHEALYYVAQQNGLSSSVEVRMVIRNLFAKNLDVDALAKSVRQMGSSFFWWEHVVSKGIYYSQNNPSSYLKVGFLFDPVLDGRQFEFIYNTVDPSGVSGPHESSTLECSQDPDLEIAQCHTVRGPQNCTFDAFDAELDGGFTFNMLCDGHGLLRMSTKKPGA